MNNISKKLEKMMVDNEIDEDGGKGLQGVEGVDWEMIEAKYFSSVDSWGEEGVDWEWGRGVRGTTKAKRMQAKADGRPLAPKKICFQTVEEDDDDDCEESDEEEEEERVFVKPRLMKKTEKVFRKVSSVHPTPPKKIPARFTELQVSILHNLEATAPFWEIIIRGAGPVPVCYKNGTLVSVRRDGNVIGLSASQAEAFASKYMH